MAVVLNSLSPAEIEFLAENELVTIDPNVNLDQLHFISVRKGAEGARERARQRRSERGSEGASEAASQRGGDEDEEDEGVEE